MSSQKFYISTPIYYANAAPHIGSTYTTVAADVLARYHRLAGDKVFFLTGTDEHGAKIAQSAAKANKSPQAFVDEQAANFLEAWKKMNVSYDNFLRTTDPKHKSAAEKALAYLHDNNYIYKGEYKGLYCVGCEQYKTEKELVGGKCPDHNTAPEEMIEECYMFKLSAFADDLKNKIEKDELRILPVERKNEVLGFLRTEKLEDIACSRKNVKWGIALPWDKEHTAYVWIEAFLNYLTGLGWDGDPKKAPAMWPPQVQLMAKDILRVHATIWPALLLALGLPIPETFFIHGYFLVDGQKMSKSIGNVIAPGDLTNKYGVDATRYLLMSAAVFGYDGDISWSKFDEKYNADLANGLGNLVARTSNLLEKNEIGIELEMGSDKDLISKFNLEITNYHFDEALRVLWQKLREMDEYISEQAPWKIKDKAVALPILKTVAQNILNVAALLQAFMPTTAEKIIKQFSEKLIKKGEALFPRIGDTKVDKRAGN